MKIKELAGRTFEMLKEHFLAVLMSGIIFALTLSATVDNTFGDNHLNLLTSQAIIEHGSTCLDPYIEAYGHDSIVQGRLHTLTVHDEHYYYYFPVATPIAAIPFVGIANLFGQDMAVYQEARSLQKTIAACWLVLLYLILYAMALQEFRRPAAAILAGIAVLGTSIASTLGTGLWSHNLATLCVAYVIWRLYRSEKMAVPPNPYLLGMALFTAYLARPNMAPFVALVYLYLLIRDRRTFIRALPVTILGLAGLVLYAQMEFGTWLPNYYDPIRMSEPGEPLYAFFGNLFSPARGCLSSRRCSSWESRPWPFGPYAPSNSAGY